MAGGCRHRLSAAAPLTYQSISVVSMNSSSLKSNDTSNIPADDLRLSVCPRKTENHGKCQVEIPKGPSAKMSSLQGTGVSGVRAPGFRVSGFRASLGLWV